MIATFNALIIRLLLVGACAAAGGGAVMLGMRYPPVACIVLAGLVWRSLRRRHGFGWSHGTARWAELHDFCRYGLLGHRGPILGRFAPSRPLRWQGIRTLFSLRTGHEMACRGFLAAFLGARWNRDRMVRLPSHVHMMTAAPAGRGKGVSVVIPNLLALPGSVVVTDPKGENFKLTAEHRRKRFGHRVLRLDPFGLCGPGSDSFNPLSCIDPQAPDFADQCRDVANMLVVRSGTEHDPHWNDSAELVLCAFIAFVCGCEADPAKRTLSVVRGIVSSPDSFKRAVATMQKVEHPEIRRFGTLLEWFKDKELNSVLTSVNRHTQFMDSPAISAVLNGTNFDPRELRGGNRSLYLILPADRISTLAPLMRLWVGMTIRLLARGGADESRPVLFLLDEAAHLGRIQVLEDAVTLMRGMGIRLWFFFQSLAQLKACYGDKAEVMLDCFDTQQFFGSNSYESAEAISRRIGECTISTVSYTENSGWSRPDSVAGKEPQPGSYSGGSSSSTSDMARRLIKPEEILCMPDHTALVLHRNLPPMSVRLLRYYDAPEFRKGRSGRQRGLGLPAGVAAAALLAIGVTFAAFAYQLPDTGGPRFAEMPAAGLFGREEEPAYESPILQPAAYAPRARRHRR